MTREVITVLLNDKLFTRLFHPSHSRPRSTDIPFSRQHTFLLTGPFAQALESQYYTPSLSISHFNLVLLHPSRSPLYQNRTLYFSTFNCTDSYNFLPHSQLSNSRNLALSKVSGRRQGSRTPHKDADVSVGFPNFGDP